MKTSNAQGTNTANSQNGYDGQEMFTGEGEGGFMTLPSSMSMNGSPTGSSSPSHSRSSHLRVINYSQCASLLY